MSGRLNATQGSRREDDLESIASFASGPVSTRPTLKYAWSGGAQVDHDSYHRMLEDYRAAKAKESKDELKIKQLAAQLARTEEAAKRALIRTDQGAKGSTAQQLLDAQRQIQQLQAENSDLSSKLAREKKRANDFRSAAEESRRRLEAALKEQRSLVRKLGEAERSLGSSAAARSAARRAAAEQEFWSEEAGRRFAVQQEELVALREQAEQLQQQLAAAVPAESAARYEATIKELQQLVHFYEQRLTSGAAAAGFGGATGMAGFNGAAGSVQGLGMGGGSSSEGGCGSWLLESLTEGGACYLWEQPSGRVFTDVPDGHWPRPVGIKADVNSSIQLGCKGRLDATFRALADSLNPGRSNSPGPMRINRPGNSSSKALTEALQQLISKGGCAASSCSSVSTGLVDSRDMVALLAQLAPGAAHKELVEVLAWLQQQQQQQQQSLSLGDVEAALSELLTARDAVRSGRDLSVNEALLRVRRLLRHEPRAVAAAFEAAAECQQDGCLAGMQVVELLRQQQLLPDLSPNEARYLLVLLHEWDLTGNNRHSLTDVYAALQLLKLVRLAPGTLPAAAAAVPDRPDSRLSTTSTSMTTSTATGTDRPAQGGSSSRQLKQAATVGRRGGMGNAAAAAAAGAAAVGVGSLKEAYLSERVAALEAELSQAKHSSGAVHSHQVESLRAELARAKSRLSELENDFLSLDVVANTEVGDYDADMRKAWFTAAAFKKRYVEHKLELDAIKATAEKMQAALDDTHRALHAEAARRMALEEAAAVAKMEAGRAKELAAAVATERAERLKLEKDYLELQSKAFAAPGGALAEVRSLREELLAARRERAVGEAREAELRREIASIKRQLEGVSPEEHRRLVRELADTKMKLVACELELRAALDKLEVYRRADNAAAAAADTAATAATVAGYSGAAGTGVGGLSGALQPDEGKSEAELRSELMQLRQAMALEAGELEKMRKLLDTEASISLEAKAALEEAQSALTAAKAEAAQQLAKLRRELDSRDERIRKLEAQLRSAYGGLNRAALRASAAAAAAGEKSGGGVRVSRVGMGSVVAGGGAAGVGQSLEEVLLGLQPHENVIELVVAEAVLVESELAPEATTFLAWDFFLHDSQATPLAPGLRPTYDTTVQYVVEADSFLLDYLSNQQLALELFEARGWNAAAVGVAHLPLKLLLQDLEVGAALGVNRAWHYVDIVGSRGQQLGRLRVGLRVAKTMDKLLLQYKAAQHDQLQQQPQAAAGAAGSAETMGMKDGLVQQQQRQQQHDGGTREGWSQEQLHALQVLQQAAQQADAEPTRASHLLVSIHRCDGLTQQQQQQQQAVSSAAAPVPVQCPYVHYMAPGRVTGHDTSIGSGSDPVFEDAASWGLFRSNAVEQALKQHQLQVAVFDDAIADPAAALLGVAAVPLASLAEGIPVEGMFELINPTTGQPSGRVFVTAAWHNPLAAAAAGNKQLKPRIPLLDPAAAAAAKEAAAGRIQQQEQQQQQPQQQQQQQTWIHEQHPEMLSAMPMLTAAGLAAGIPGTSSAAAAAVAAAVGKKQQQQQQQLPLLRSGLASDPLAAFTGAASAARPAGGMLLLQGQQLASASLSAGSHRYGNISPINQSMEGPLLQGSAAAAAALQAPPTTLSAAAAAAVAAVSGPNGPAGSAGAGGLAAALPVMRQVSPSPDTWTAFETTIYFKIEGLSLTADALRDPALQHVLLAHMFCEDFTSAAQQCTATVPKGPGQLSFAYCVAYTVADPATKAPTAAGRALAQALAAADAGQAPHMMLPVLLASSQVPQLTDFSQIEVIGSCDFDLSNIWQGLTGDIINTDFDLLPAPEKAALYPSGCAGQLRLTFVASKALAALKQHTLLS